MTETKSKKAVIEGWHCWIYTERESQDGQIIAVDDYGVVVKTPKYKTDKEIFFPWDKILKIERRKD